MKKPNLSKKTIKLMRFFKNKNLFEECLFKYKNISCLDYILSEYKTDKCFWRAITFLNDNGINLPKEIDFYILNNEWKKFACDLISKEENDKLNNDKLNNDKLIKIISQYNQNYSFNYQTSYCSNNDLNFNYTILDYISHINNF